MNDIEYRQSSLSTVEESNLDYSYRKGSSRSAGLIATAKLIELIFESVR
jgi:hypothetical protein